jgi:hypothetical protein
MQSRSTATLTTALLTLATDVFREQADKDYIVARTCYRMDLRDQFLWASLQACEKYLKAILLFNGKSARYDPEKYDPNKPQKNKEFGHNVSWLFDVVIRDIPDLLLDRCPSWLPQFLKYLTNFGDNRYVTKATFTTGDELRNLDEAVWILRRVCQNFNWTPAKENLRPKLIAAAMRTHARNNPALYRAFGAIDGFLERKLKQSKNDPAREALVWNNMFFANRQRRRVTYKHFSSSENPPHIREWFYNNPKIMAKIAFYIKLP